MNWGSEGDQKARGGGSAVTISQGSRVRKQGADQLWGVGLPPSTTALRLNRRRLTSSMPWRPGASLAASASFDFSSASPPTCTQQYGRQRVRKEKERKRRKTAPGCGPHSGTAQWSTHLKEVQQLVGPHAAQRRIVRADDSLGNVQLEALQPHDLLLQRVFGDEAVDVDRLAWMLRRRGAE